VTASGDVVLRADGRRIEQALDILVDNALRHGDGTVGLAAEAANGRVVLTVSDDGPGFPAAFLPHAFERFSRADAARSAGGAGLGLAIVQAIAQAHGGSAGAANRAEGGVNVWIPLPSRLNAEDAARGDSRDVG
jgi:signal transduction histidine kinase